MLTGTAMRAISRPGVGGADLRARTEGTARRGMSERLSISKVGTDLGYVLRPAESKRFDPRDSPTRSSQSFMALMMVTARLIRSWAAGSPAASARSMALSASRTIVHARARPSSMPARSQMISSRRRSDHRTCEPVPSSPARFHRAGATSKADVAGHRLRVDGQPGGAVGAEDVGVVQVGVQQPVLGRCARHELARQRGRLVEVAPRQHRWGGAQLHHLAFGVCREAGQARMRGSAQRRQEVADDAAGLVDLDPAEVAVVQAFEQHGEACRVGSDEAHGPVAVPRLQGQRLGGRLGVRPRHLEHALAADAHGRRGPRRAAGPARRRSRRRACCCRSARGPTRRAGCRAGPAGRRASPGPTSSPAARSRRPRGRSVPARGRSARPASARGSRRGPGEGDERHTPVGGERLHAAAPPGGVVERGAVGRCAGDVDGGVDCRAEQVAGEPLGLAGVVTGKGSAQPPGVDVVGPTPRGRGGGGRPASRARGCGGRRSTARRRPRSRRRGGRSAR